MVQMSTSECGGKKQLSSGNSSSASANGISLGELRAHASQGLYCHSSAPVVVANRSCKPDKKRKRASSGCDGVGNSSGGDGAVVVNKNNSAARVVDEEVDFTSKKSRYDTKKQQQKKRQFVRVKNFDGICEHFQGLVQVFCCSDGSKGRKYSESEIKSAEKRLPSNGSIFKNSQLLNSMREIFIEIGGVMEFLIDNYGLSDMKNWEKSIESDHKALLRVRRMLDHVIKPCVKVINHDISENLKAVNAERLKAREQGQNHKNKNKKGCSVSSSSRLSLSATTSSTSAVQDQTQVAEEAEV